MTSGKSPSASAGRKGRRPFKLFLMLFLFVGAFAAVLVRLFIVQVVDGSDYREQARQQYESRLTLAPDRGSIYDRNIREIATTLQKLSIAVDPKLVKQPGKICAVLDSLTGRSDSVYRAKIAKANSRFVWLERCLDGVEHSSLASMEDPGLIRRWESSRNFAYGSLASQIIGFTNVDNKGLSGIELEWDTVLHGTPGYAIMQRDGRGNKRRSPDLPTIPPRKGNSIVLTLDMDIQGIVESELRKGVFTANAVSGTAIAVQPSSGEILAMASYPTYDPNDISTASDALVRNRSITDMYEPGSTFKLVTAAALMEENHIRPDDSVDGLGGALQISPDHTIRDEVPVERVLFREAVEKSSNVVFADLVDSLSRGLFYKYVRDFGFGIYLGIDLPGEVRGLVRKPREFDATTKKFMAYGYGLAATALQIVNAYATVANGGAMMKPFIVKAVLDSDDDVAREFEPQMIRQVISRETASRLTDMLTGVVERGSGKTARVRGLKIAGKTGTAQQLKEGRYGKEDYTASFAGFFPAETPEIALIIMLNKPRKGYYGSKVAAPIFQRIAQRLISAGLINVPDFEADIAAAENDPDSLAQEEPRVRVPDIRGLEAADARDLLQRYGLRLKTDFSDGIVQTQEPRPGSKAEKGHEVLAHLRSSLVTARADSTPELMRLHTARPDVRGLTLRRALNLLHAARIKTRVLGSGVVRKQTWRKENGETLCILECRR